MRVLSMTRAAIACSFATFALAGCGSDSPSPSVPSSPPMAVGGGDGGETTDGGEETRNGSHLITFPANFDQMVMYGDYRRGDGGELAYALPVTLDAAKKGETLPIGTALVLEVFNDDEVASYFVMQKGEGWAQGYSEDERTGDWNFQEFATNRQVGANSEPLRCMACHGDAEEDDFNFSRDRMESYMP